MLLIHTFFVGIEIQGLPESFTGEMNAEDVRDSMCMEIITSSLIARKCNLEIC